MKGVRAIVQGILAWLHAVVVWPFRQADRVLEGALRLLARVVAALRRLAGRMLAPIRRLWIAVTAPVRRLWAKVTAPVRRLLARAVAGGRRLLAKLIAPLRPIGRAIWKVVGITAALFGGLFEVLWRALLLIAGLSMPIGGILLALGLDDTSEALVTAAYFIGILAVPTWLATRVLARIRPPGKVRLRRRRTALERSPEDEDLSGRTHQEFHPHDLVLPGEPA